MQIEVSDFEIHLTVQTTDVQKFREYCLFQDMKPIILELQNDTSVMTDVMTSTKIKGTYDDAQCASLRQELVLAFGGFNTVRCKIEASPKCNLNPLYMESHLRVICTNEWIPRLKEITKHHDAHLSRNIYKKIDNDRFYIMLTLREYDKSMFPLFEYKVGELKNHLEYLGFVIDKVEIEKVIWDSNMEHDKNWIDGQ